MVQLENRQIEHDRQVRKLKRMLKRACQAKAQIEANLQAKIVHQNDQWIKMQSTLQNEIDQLHHQLNEVVYHLNDTVAYYTTQWQIWRGNISIFY